MCTIADLSLLGKREALESCCGLLFLLTLCEELYTVYLYIAHLCKWMPSPAGLKTNGRFSRARRSSQRGDNASFGVSQTWANPAQSPGICVALGKSLAGSCPHHVRTGASPLQSYHKDTWDCRSKPPSTVSG